MSPRSPRSLPGRAPICRALDVSASAYCQRDSGRRSARAEDERLLARIEETSAADYYAYEAKPQLPRWCCYQDAISLRSLRSMYGASDLA